MLPRQKAEDNIVIEMQAQATSEPCALSPHRNGPTLRSNVMEAEAVPKGPLKRIYATLNVMEANDKETVLATSDANGQTESYVPSAFSNSDLEPESMDPKSDSAASNVGPSKMDRKRNEAISPRKPRSSTRYRQSISPSLPSQRSHEDVREHSSSHVSAVADLESQTVRFLLKHQDIHRNFTHLDFLEGSSQRHVK